MIILLSHYMGWPMISWHILMESVKKELCLLFFWNRRLKINQRTDNLPDENISPWFVSNVGREELDSIGQTEELSIVNLSCSPHVCFLLFQGLFSSYVSALQLLVCYDTNLFSAHLWFHCLLCMRPCVYHQKNGHKKYLRMYLRRGKVKEKQNIKQANPAPYSHKE